MCLLCAISASALSYASPYKGAGRNGYIYTTSSARSKAIGGGGSMAQAPVASMGSTSSVGSRGISYGGTVAAVPQVQGISTAASNIAGGVTTYGNEQICGPKKVHIDLPGVCGHCDWEWSEEYDDYVCTVCGHHMDTGCTCDPCTCDVPVGDDWTVRIFLIVLAGAYAIYKVRTRQETIEAV